MRSISHIVNEVWVDVALFGAADGEQIIKWLTSK